MTHVSQIGNADFVCFDFEVYNDDNIDVKKGKVTSNISLETAREIQQKLNEIFPDGNQKTSPNPQPTADEPRWEPVTHDPKGYGHTYRLAVPGGWLYRTVTYSKPEGDHPIYGTSGGKPVAVATTFVRDEEGRKRYINDALARK